MARVPLDIHEMLDRLPQMIGANDRRAQAFGGQPLLSGNPQAIKKYVGARAYARGSRNAGGPPDPVTQALGIERGAYGPDVVPGPGNAQLADQAAFAETGTKTYEPDDPTPALLNVLSNIGLQPGGNYDFYVNKLDKMDDATLREVYHAVSAASFQGNLPDDVGERIGRMPIQQISAQLANIFSVLKP